MKSNWLSGAAPKVSDVSLKLEKGGERMMQTGCVREHQHLSIYSERERERGSRGGKNKGDVKRGATRRRVNAAALILLLEDDAAESLYCLSLLSTNSVRRQKTTVKKIFHLPHTVLLQQIWIHPPLKIVLNIYETTESSCLNYWTF